MTRRSTRADAFAWWRGRRDQHGAASDDCLGPVEVAGGVLDQITKLPSSLAGVSNEDSWALSTRARRRTTSLPTAPVAPVTRIMNLLSFAPCVGTLRSTSTETLPVTHLVIPASSTSLGRTVVSKNCSKAPTVRHGQPFLIVSGSAQRLLRCGVALALRPCLQACMRPRRPRRRGWLLVGRRDQLEAIGEAIGGGAIRGVVIHGPAGVGKSRLADECFEVLIRAGRAGGRVRPQAARRAGCRSVR